MATQELLVHWWMLSKVFLGCSACHQQLSLIAKRFESLVISLGRSRLRLWLGIRKCILWTHDVNFWWSGEIVLVMSRFEGWTVILSIFVCCCKLSWLFWRCKVAIHIRRMIIWFVKESCLTLSCANSCTVWLGVSYWVTWILSNHCQFRRLIDMRRSSWWKISSWERWLLSKFSGWRLKGSWVIIRKQRLQEFLWPVLAIITSVILHTCWVTFHLLFRGFMEARFLTHLFIQALWKNILLVQNIVELVVLLCSLVGSINLHCRRWLMLFSHHFNCSLSRVEIKLIVLVTFLRLWFFLKLIIIAWLGPSSIISGIRSWIMIRNCICSFHAWESEVLFVLVCGCLSPI